jgi:NADH-quinone oxidoreductase subunit M
MQFFANHALLVVLATPLIAALVLALLPQNMITAAHALASAFGLLGFLVALPLLARFTPGSSTYVFKESVEWIPSLDAHFALGVDGISLLFVVLTAFIGMLCVFASRNVAIERPREYFVLLFLLQTAMLGVFVSTDFFLLYFFWAFTLVPIYFLIAIWGGERRLSAAIKFFLYSLVGCVVFLLALVALYYNAAQITGLQTFDMPSLLATAQLFPPHLKTAIFWTFFLALAVRAPLFPFHTWLPDALVEAPTPVAVLVASVALKMAGYGFLRIALPFVVRNPSARAMVPHLVIVLALISFLYGAVVCLMQKDIKRLIAYACLSQTGLAALAIFSLTPLALTGACLVQINHAICAAALFFLAGMLIRRRETSLISAFGGLATPMRAFSAIFLIVALSAVGIPPLSGFIGQFAALQGIFQANRAWAAWSALGIVLTAACFIWLFQRMAWGPLTDEANRTLRDLNAAEYAIVLPLIIVIFWIGLYPRPLFAILEQSVSRIIQQVNPAYFEHRLTSAVSATASRPLSPSSEPR